MKENLNIIVLGTGGVASYLLPPLAKQFNLKGFLIDGDTLEERNLDRQLFRKEDVGENKAQALWNTNPQAYKDLAVYPEYLKASKVDNFCAIHEEALEDIQYSKDMSVILCMVDNHPARRAAEALSVKLGIPMINGANERLTGHAFIYHPRGMKGWALPSRRYPDIATGEENDPTDPACTDEEAPAFPQLAGTNFIMAGLMLQLIYILRLHHSSEQEAWEPFRVIEFQTTHNKIENTTYERVLNT